MKKKKGCGPVYKTLDYSRIDADSYVAQRSLPQLDALWDDACAALLAAQKGDAPKVVRLVRRDVDEVGEVAFTWILNKTGHEKLAAQIADDFRMIQEAYWYAVTDDPYINTLTGAYRAGRLPMLEDFNE